MSRRAILVVSAAGALMAIAVVATARGLPAIVTSSDLAITELYTELATRGQLLIGPYSRFGWSHPGPFYFYVLAPLYAASGHQAATLFAAAVAINLAALFTLAWVVSRDDRGPLLVLLTVACFMLAWRVPRLLASPWTAHVPVLASLTFVVLCGAVVGGRHRMLPMLILFGSFISQTHLSYVPMVGVLGTVAVATVVVRYRRKAAAVVGVSAGLWILVWLPTLIDASTNSGGNVAALWRFFMSSSGSSHSFSEAFVAWSYALNGILRADLGLPWGGHFVQEPSAWRGPLAVGQVAGLALMSRWSRRDNRQVEAGLALSAALASIVGLWAVTRIRGDILDHELFPLTALGALNLAILATAAVRHFMPLAWRWHEHAVVAASATALVGCTLVGVQHLRVFTSYELRRSDTPRIPATYEVLRGFFEQRGIERPLFRMEGDATSDGAGILLRLMQAGWPVAVEDVSTSVFPPEFAKTGQEDALVNLSSREGIHLAIAARPGNVVLRDRHPLFVDVVLRRH